jgi:tetratricopeptide (TPR) repeat protein
MATLTQAVATYSYIDRPMIDLGTLDQNDPDIALLVKVNTLMASAASSFTSRTYSDAINSYHAAESLIFSALDPGWTPELGVKLHPMLPRNPELFTPLLSATSQWLNIIPVAPPASPVRPTVPVSTDFLRSVTSLDGAGLSVVSANQTNALNSLADMRLAQIYAGQDNQQASSNALTRAKGLDPAIAKALAPPGIRPEKNPTKGAAAGRTVRAAATRLATGAVGPAAGSTAATASVADTMTLAASGRVALETFPVLPISVLAQKQVGLLTGSSGQYAVKTIQWAAGANPNPSDITNLIYSAHAMAPTLPDAITNVSTIWEQATLLPHDYFYNIPLALAECYEAMGDYAAAETYYLQAAGYTYINTAVEGPYVWLRLATLYSEWGDSLYQQNDPTDAATQYSKVLTVGSTTPPSSQLYTLAGLNVAAKIATALIPQLPTLAASGVSTVSPDDVSIASVLLKIYGKLTQISAGLDFWGVYAEAIPIWTFTYLQQVAVNFAQFALGAEQQVINFWSQYDQATLTQAQLQSQQGQAAGQVGVAQDQAAAAQAQAGVYLDGLTLAGTRAVDASTEATVYEGESSQALQFQAEAQLTAGGDSGDIQQVNTDAAAWLSGGSVDTSGVGGISGMATRIATAWQLAASELSQQYQVFSMNNTAMEMQQAVTVAQAQLTAANAQVLAATAALSAAQLDYYEASQVLAAFNGDIFTPQTWWAMGNYMLNIYQQYMYMALQAAKLMQQAYNFENDTSLTYIKDSYPGLLQGLLAADSLMADIQQFTFDQITAKRGKKQLVKTSISLAQNYGYLFRTQLVQTGEMTFETTLDDFDTVFPGSYQGRIQSVSVDIQGIVPPTGMSGTLTNGGISFYRLPSDIATPETPSKVRIQDADTLILSDYNPAIDGQLNSGTGNQLGIFEGAGVASTWTLSLPKQLNDINYGTLTDVVLTFVYETRFDPQLVPTVLAQLASRPGFYDRQWAIPLGWLYPDLFYGFVQTGTLTLSLGASDFAVNQTSPTVTAVGLLMSMAPGTPGPAPRASAASGITITLTAPGQTAVTGVTDSTGAISSQSAGSPWAPAVGGSALGDWVITLPVASNPSLAPGGVLDLSALANMVLVLDYSFTPRS